MFRVPVFGFRVYPEESSSGFYWCYNELVKTKSVAEILKKSGFKKASPEEKVAAILDNLQSTHDVVFVFDQKKFLGAVNLYHSFVNKKVGSSEKLKNILYHPPILTPKTPILEVARLMVESRVYVLPVTDQEEFLGTVFAKDILSLAKRQLIFSNKIIQKIEPRKPIFADLNISVSQALSLMVKNNTNRLLVVDKNGVLLGILTLFDLRKIFTTPRERVSFLTRTPIRKELAGQPIKKFYSRLVVSVGGQDPLKRAVTLMTQNNIGSLVVFSGREDKKVMGLITFRDLLKVISDMGNKKETVSLTRHFNKRSLKLARQNSLKKLNRLLKNNALLASRVRSISLDLKEIAKGRPQARLPLMEATARVRFNRGNKVLRTKVKGRKVSFMVDKIIHRIKDLARKQGR